MKLTNKKVLFGAAALLIVLVAAVQQCRGQAELYGSYVSDYVRRGVALADASAQVGVEATVSVENKFLPVTEVYATGLLNRPNSGNNIRDGHVGLELGTKLVQVDVGLRNVGESGVASQTEVYGGVKLDVFGNPGFYVSNSSTHDFTALELRAHEAFEVPFVPEGFTTGVAGVLGHRDAPVETTYYEATLWVGYQLNETVALYTGAGLYGTSTDEFDNGGVYTVGVKASF
jgi:hypothetical protein